MRRLSKEESEHYLELVGEGIPSFYLENVVVPHLLGRQEQDDRR